MESIMSQSAFAVYQQTKKRKRNRKTKIQQKNSHSTSLIENSTNKTKLKIINKPIKKSKEKMEKPKTVAENVKKTVAEKAKQKKTTVTNSDVVVDDDKVTSGVRLLSWILSPCTTSDLFENYWESNILHVKRNKSDYYSSILTSEKLDKMLRENPLYFTRNVDVVSYENGKRETHNPAGRAAPAAVWDFYMNGCSVRILNPQTYNQKIHILLSTLQEYFGTMVGANIYLTPPGSQGFAPHYDDIEAFVLQLEGRKHWKLYEPKNRSSVLARDSSHNFSRDELGTLIKEVTLEAGDLLYFPRGTVHEAFTDKELHSLHITVSMYQHTAYADLLEHLLPKALKVACSSDVDFRRGLPLQYLRHVGSAASGRKEMSDVRHTILNTVEKLMQTLIIYADVDAAADQLGRKFMYDALPPVMDKNERSRTARDDSESLINGKIPSRAEFTSEVEVRLLRYHAIHLVCEENGQNYLYYCTENSKIYHGEEEQSLEIEKAGVPIVKALIDSYPKYVAVGSLPTDDDELKLRVVADLWEKELIVTKKPLITQREDTNTSSG